MDRPPSANRGSTDVAWSGRHSGPHGSGADEQEFRGWRSFVHLARELKLARLARLAYPYRWRAVLAVIAMLVVTATSLAFPYLIKVAIDSGITQGDMGVVDTVIVVFLGVALLNLGASYTQTYFVSWVGERVILDLRRQLFAHIQKLTLDFFSRQRTGWIVSRLTNDIDALSQLVTDGVVSLVTNSLTLVGAVVLLFVLDWRLALASLAVLPGLAAATLVFRTRSARSYARVRNRVGDVSAHFQESISGVRVLKSFRREQADYDKLVAANAAYRQANWETVFQSGLYFPVVELLSAIGVVIVLWFGGYLVSEEALTRSACSSPSSATSRASSTLFSSSRSSTTRSSRRWPPSQKIYTVLDTEPDLVDAPDAKPLPEVRGAVTFEGVTFGYDEGTDVLHDLSFSAPAGSTIALVGTTGAGKSTIVKLLARFYDPGRRRRCASTATICAA